MLSERHFRRSERHRFLPNYLRHIQEPLPDILLGTNRASSTVRGPDVEADAPAHMSALVTDIFHPTNWRLSSLRYDDPAPTYPSAWQSRAGTHGSTII